MDVSEKMLSKLQTEVSVTIDQLRILQAQLDCLFHHGAASVVSSVDEGIMFREKVRPSSPGRPQHRGSAPEEDVFGDIIIQVK